LSARLERDIQAPGNMATRRLGFCGPSLSLRASSRGMPASLGIGFPEGEIVPTIDGFGRKSRGIVK
jgi:hypothetical protein